MAETASINGALTELLSAVSGLARIVDSVSDCNADMPHVQDAIEAARQHIAVITEAGRLAIKDA